MIKLYQLTLGLFFRGACKFHPTCSEYTKQAIFKYGVIKGGLLSLKRLTKCHPYSKHYGIDEV